MSDQAATYAFPISSPQLRLWLVDQLAPGSAAYNIHLALGVTGLLDVALLRRAAADLARRHEVLRTVFRDVDGEPMQIIAPGLEPTFRVVDVSGSADDVRRRIDDEVMRGFDLAAGPLVRVTVLRMSPTDHVLVAVMHHIVADGWSMDILARELTALYEAGLAGRAPSLPDLPIQYADFAVWQRGWLASEAAAAQLAYWRAALTGATPLELPADRPRPAAPSLEGAAVRVAIRPSLAARLREIARSSAATLYMVLLAGFKAVLARLSDREDILVGGPVANRTRPELEPLIGFFVNMLVLRTDLSGDPTFGELLARVRDVCLAAYANQDLPFEELVKAVAPDRDVTVTPLVRAVFVLQNTPRREFALPGLHLRALDTGTATAKVDISLALGEAPDGGLEGQLEYRTDLFDPASARRVFAYLVTLLESATADPSRRLSELPLLAPEEMDRVVRTSRGAPCDIPDRCLHEQFEARVDAHPDRLAISGGGSCLTYAELDARSNRLAHHLRALGVAPDSPVAIALPRSADWVIAMLGVLKAGAAYVPIDPDYPAERRSYMAEDSGAVLVIDDVFVRDPAIAARPTSRPSRSAGPDNLAYVIYTSGSTGQPKGVMVAHASVSHLLATQARELELTAADAVLQLHSVSFDPSVAEILGALTAGARLVLTGPRPQERWEDVCATIADEEVTLIFAGPSMLRALVDVAADRGPWQTVRAVVTGGEPLPRSLQDRLAARAPSARLHHLYGPTEATVHLTYWVCEDDGAGAHAPVGRPAGDSQVYILDRHGELAVPGAIGELHLAGPQIARGYWRRPRLTAEVFVPSRIPGHSGQRLYRTGDFARRRPDGVLEIVGRRDDQIKVRGVRIELREVEAALLRHPAIDDAAVVARRGDVETTLVAYIAPRVPDDLPAFVARTLPRSMHPTTVVEMTSLPRTPGGKLDRAALPAANAAAPVDDAPSSSLETELAAIWQEVLGRPVGIRQNFFAAGGDSLRAVRVVAAARGRGIALRVQDLFEQDTIEELASALVARRESERADSLEPFALLTADERSALPAGVVDAYPPSSLQAGMLLEGAAGAYQTALSICIRARLVPDRLRDELAALAARHPALRTRFDLTSFSRPLQVIQSAAEIPLEMADLAEIDGPAAGASAAWLDRERARPFDRARAPLVRVAVRRRSPDTFQFTWTAHHAVLDGWSTAMLLRELFSNYFADTLGRQLLAPPDHGMRGLVALESDAAADPACAAFWSSYLEGVDVFRLPVTPPPTGTGVERRAIQLPARLAERVRAVAAARGVPVKSVFLAAHVAMLAVASGRTEVVTGVMVNARPETAGSDRLVGLFVGTLPLRCAIAGRTWAEIVASVHADERAWQPHRFYSLARVQAAMGPVALFDSIFGNNGVDVFDRLPHVDGFEVLEAHWTEETPVPLLIDLVELRETGAIELRVTFRASVLSGTQVDRLIGYLLRAVDAIAADPDARFDETELLSADERAAALRDSRAPRSPGPPSDPDMAVAWWARHRGSAVAVIDGDRRTTYAELDRQTSELARRLRARGIGPESMVGLCFERSTDLLVAILATHRAGAAFLPIDPSYPDERLSIMLDRARVDLVLGHQVTRDRLAACQIAPILIDRDGAPPAPASAPVPVPRALPENLAYVIFTSGSTGIPKAAAVSRQALAHFTRAMRDALDLGVDDRFLQLAPVGFDVLVEEVFPVWAAGGAVVVPRGAGPFAPADLWGMVAELGVTVFEVTTSYWQSLADWLAAQGATVPARLRWVLIGSEKVSTERLGDWLARGAPLVHVYGVTEVACTSVILRTRDVPDLASRPGGALPIGWPVGDGTAYVFDRAGRLAPAGATGELYLGGPQVARGYLGAPGLTAERFVPDPLAATPGARMYRTGDLVRRLEGGPIEFVGRADTQVQIRGHRVELGEVEAAVSAFPGVRDAVVVARDDGGGRRLAAYYTAADGEVSPARLRAHLRGRLPGYMVPAVFVRLAALPISPNGKVDRRSLPEEPDQPVGPGRPPETEIERMIAAAWARILRCATPSLDDNFFDAGGDSLSAMQLVSALGDAAGASLALGALFDDPTVEGLARAVAAARAAGPSTSVPEPLLPRSDRSAPAVLSSAQLRLWFLEQLAPGSPTYNMPVVQRVRGPLDVAALQSALEEIVHRHEALRTVFAVVDDRPVQIVLPGRPVGFTLVDLSAAPGDERVPTARRWVEGEVGRGFDLAAGPLVRVGVLRLGPLDHVVSLVIHHAAADGWSMGILTGELATLYDSIRAGRRPSLPDLPVQYADFAAWQRRHLGGDELSRQVAYWRSALAGMTPLVLPCDRPRPPAPTHRATTARRSIEPDVVAGLQQIVRSEGATLYMGLLAGFLAVLARWTGQRDVSVGTPIAARPRPELDRVVGCFFNVLLIRADVRAERGFDQLVRDVRGACLAAYAHQDAPLDNVVRAVMPEERGRNALFQTMFIMDEDPPPPPLAGEIGLEPWDVALPLSKRDLTFTVAPSGSAVDVTVTWNRDVLDDDTCMAVTAAYQRLLAAVAARPDQALSAIALDLPAGRVQTGAPAVDRTPALDPVRLAAATERVASAWREVLGPAAQDHELNFFDAGGHSLLAVQLAARINARGGPPVPLAWLFAFPTISGLARAIAARRSATPTPGD